MLNLKEITDITRQGKQYHSFYNTLAAARLHTTYIHTTYLMLPGKAGLNSAWLFSPHGINGPSDFCEKHQTKMLKLGTRIKKGVF